MEPPVVEVVVDPTDAAEVVEDELTELVVEESGIVVVDGVDSSVLEGVVASEGTVAILVEASSSEVGTLVEDTTIGVNGLSDTWS